MLLFTCDYLEGAHEKILQRLTETNLEKMPGYENDPTVSALQRRSGQPVNVRKEAYSLL